MNDALVLLEQLGALGLLLRTGRSAEACADLPAVMEALAQCMAGRPPALQEAFALQMAHALQAWERHDWLGLADSLDVDLPAALQA